MIPVLEGLLTVEHNLDGTHIAGVGHLHLWSWRVTGRIRGACYCSSDAHDLPVHLSADQFRRVSAALLAAGTAADLKRALATAWDVE